MGLPPETGVYGLEVFYGLLPYFILKSLVGYHR